jgi:hypothetical protein
MILLKGSCSELFLVEKPLSYSQCLHLQLFQPPDGAKLNGIIFSFTEGAHGDENFIGYFIHCSSETVQWEIAWTLRYKCDFLILTDRVQVDRPKICILALVEHLYNFCKLSCPYELGTCWQIHLFILRTGLGSSLCGFLICLKAQTICIQPDKLEMRLELSMQKEIFNAERDICMELLQYSTPQFG